MSQIVQLKGRAFVGGVAKQIVTHDTILRMASTDQRLASADVRVLAFLLTELDNEWQPIKRLWLTNQLPHLSRTSITRATRRLVACGYLERRRIQGGPAEFRISN